MTGNVSHDDLSIGERKHPVKVTSLSADANLTTGKSKPESSRCRDAAVFPNSITLVSTDHYLTPPTSPGRKDVTSPHC